MTRFGSLEYMSMLAIWICELSVLVQDSCGAKTVLGYFYCIWSRLGIIGQLFKGGVILPLLFPDDLYNHHGSFYESCWCVEESSPLSSMAEMAVCVMNVVTQSSLLS